MTRLNVPGFTRLARAASSTELPTLTIATHPDGSRWAAWPYGCLLLPDALVEELAWPADGIYAIAKGALTPTDAVRLSPELVAAKMLPALSLPRVTATQNGWSHQLGELTRRYLIPDGAAAVAVNDDLWQAWNKATSGDLGLVTSSAGPAIVWATTPGGRADALLLTIHPRYTPEPPTWAPTQDRTSQ